MCWSCSPTSPSSSASGLSQRSKSDSVEGFALGDRQIAWWAVLASHPRGGNQRGDVPRRAGERLSSSGTGRTRNLRSARSSRGSSSASSSSRSSTGTASSRLRVPRDAVRQAHAEVGVGHVSGYARACDGHAALRQRDHPRARVADVARRPAGRARRRSSGSLPARSCS